LSAADLQHTAVHNVAEALGLMSGVNVTTTGTGYFGGIDGAARGEGMFASVRGLPSEYNVNLINGANVAQGMPYSRSVQLSLLPPSGLQTIVLNKTSTAEMDGDAIGGTIDFRTPSAFDFKKDFSGSVTASGRVESRARDYGDSGLGGGLAGEMQTKFGDEKQFGVYISAYYDYRNIANSEIGAAESASNDGSWAFLHATADGKNAPGYDPARNLTSIGGNAGIAAGFERRYGGNVSFDWNVDPTLRAYAKMTYAYALTDQNTTYTQLLPGNVTYVPTSTPGVYSPNIGRIANRFWFETNPERADLATFQFGADKTAGGWTISPNVFWSFGDNDRPNHVEIDGREDKYSQNNFAYNQPSLMGYGGSHFPYPQLTPALLNSVNNIQNMYANDNGEITRIRSGQKRGGAKLDLRYDFEDGPVQAIKFGVKYSDSSRKFSNRDWSTAGINDGTTTLVGATGACTGSTSGFGALSAPVDPHFAGSDAPMSQDEFNWFGLGGKTAANGQPVQFPSVVGSVAIAFNNPDVPASGLNLSDAGLCRIFSGQISDWNQLTTAETGLTSTLPSRALKVAFRSDGSGTTFSFANHLSTVCAAGATGQVFQTDQAFTTVVAQYLSAIPSTWLGASGNPGVVTAINNNTGAIGYAESANLKSTPTATNTKVAKVNGFDPYANLPATLTFNSVLLDNVIVGRNANGTPHVQKMSPAAPVANCVLMVNPADYANVSGQYPIIAVSNLIANNKGNGADLTAVRSLFSWLYNSTHTGVNTIGKGADGTGTGFAFVASTVANARVNACINS
ncbi:hypothetical protein KCV01_g7648, partial [Aureobasidium melanogenum]